jgi:very-short-patch-repair endonuclease
MICLCEKSINPPVFRHGRFCGAYQQSTEEQRLIFFATQELNLTEPQIKDLLHREYIQQEASVTDLLGHGLKRDQWIKLIKYFGFAYRGSAQAATKSRLQKTEASCLKKFGVKNASQHDDVKRKKATTFVKNYGVDNIWKSAEFKITYAQTMQERYGKGSLPNRFGRKTEWWKQFSLEERRKILAPANLGYTKWWNALSQDERDTIIRQRIETAMQNGHSYSSKLEDRVAAMLDELGIKYKRQWFIGRKSYDFALPGKVLIEVQGDYWHANPQIYKADDVFKGNDRGQTAQMIWDHDAEKKRHAESKGFSVIYIWESDM